MYSRLALDTMGRGSSRTAPRTSGVLMASIAPLMTFAASGLRSGSMSEAFSGHTTRSGFGWAPAFTAAAACSVTFAWLSSTARRCALKYRPGWGTLPWTARNRAFGPLIGLGTVSYTHLRAHETVLDLVCRLLLEKK